MTPLVSFEYFLVIREVEQGRFSQAEFPCYSSILWRLAHNLGAALKIYWLKALAGWLVAAAE